MSKLYGGNLNANEEPIVSDSFIVTTSLSVKISDSLDVSNKNNYRQKLMITNVGPGDVWIKLQAASVDDDKKGYMVFAGCSDTILNTLSTYPGEVSAIADDADTTIYVTEL